MRVTSVSLRTELLERPGSNLVAVGSLKLDDEFQVEYIRIVRSKEGKFLVCMPSRKNGIGAFRDDCHPVNDEVRRDLTEAVLESLQLHFKVTQPVEWAIAAAVDRAVIEVSKKYQDTCYPVTQALRREVDMRVLDALSRKP